jgi:hypothetical protein
MIERAKLKRFQQIVSWHGSCICNSGTQRNEKGLKKHRWI